MYNYDAVNNLYMMDYVKLYGPVKTGHVGTSYTLSHYITGDNSAVEQNIYIL